MRYRLGLDLGANSIGWCALNLADDGTPDRILALGVRVYPDGRQTDGSSRAAERRMARGMRRNRDRYLQRRTALLNCLTRLGLMPADPVARARVAALDPYALRAEALSRALAPEELGRAIFHLNQHRGFKSNRKAGQDSNESGLIRDAARDTLAELARAGHLTLGDWLAKRHRLREGVRVRLAGTGKTAAYPFYPLRDMIEREFDVIWEAQSAWSPALTPEARAMLREIIFHQRRLKTPTVGKCWLEPTEDRMPRAMPSFQRFRIAQTLAHLTVSVPGFPTRPLSRPETSAMTDVLHKGRPLTLDQVRRKLKLTGDTDFNTRETAIAGCGTARVLGAKKVFGERWHHMSLAEQDAIVSVLLADVSDEEAEGLLAGQGLPRDEAARAVATSLPDGHGAFSAVAVGKMLPHLEAGLRYSDAVQAAGYAHHSDRRTGEIRARLPYYGEILEQRIGTGTNDPAEANQEKRLGKAPNPTVHVALNELRRLVNAIVERHGAPESIVVETLRDLGRSKRQRDDYEKEQRKNRHANDARRAKLEKLGETVNGRKLMLLRLWEQQAFDPKDRVCPYTGTIITPRMLLSDEVESDHILPFSMTLDDGAANRLLVTREANRAKAKRTPHEAFGHTPEWPAILQRVALLPANKRWRFEADALEKYAREGDFLARHLTDSAIIARWATEYLDVLAPDKVRSVPGRLTAMLRNALGLNSRSVLGKGGSMKDRTDHRHHAIDALVVALTDQGMLQRVTRAAKQAEDGGQRLLATLPPPWEGFVAETARRVQGVVVSHKPDTGWQDALHNDTAYGEVGGASGNEFNVVVRRKTVDLAGKDPRKIRVRDPMFAADVAKALAKATPPEQRAALASIADSKGRPVLRLRTVERQDSTVRIRDRRDGSAYKQFKRDGNHRLELWRMPDGTLHRNKASAFDIVSTFDAAREAREQAAKRIVHDLRPHPAARLVMRLHKNDMVVIEESGVRRVMVVKQLSANQLALADHNESGSLRDRHRNKDGEDPFEFVLVASLGRLAELKLRKVQVLPDGYVRDTSAPP